MDQAPSTSSVSAPDPAVLAATHMRLIPGPRRLTFDESIDGQRPLSWVEVRGHLSINDLAISSEDRRWFGPRPEDECGPDHDMPLQ